MPNNLETEPLKGLLEKVKGDIADAIRLDRRNVSLELLIDEVLTRRKLLPLLERKVVEARLEDARLAHENQHPLCHCSEQKFCWQSQHIAELERKLSCLKAALEGTK